MAHHHKSPHMLQQVVPRSIKISEEIDSNNAWIGNYVAVHLITSIVLISISITLKEEGSALHGHWYTETNWNYADLYTNETHCLS